MDFIKEGKNEAILLKGASGNFFLYQYQVFDAPITHQKIVKSEQKH